MNIPEMNKVIADFMGWRETVDGYGHKIMAIKHAPKKTVNVSACKYHKDIAWLFPVWLIVNEMYIKGDKRVNTTDYNWAKLALVSGNISGLYCQLYHIIQSINNE